MLIDSFGYSSLQFLFFLLNPIEIISIKDVISPRRLGLSISFFFKLIHDNTCHFGFSFLGHYFEQVQISWVIFSKAVSRRFEFLVNENFHHVGF